MSDARIIYSSPAGGGPDANVGEAGQSRVLLQGFSLLLDFLLKAETDVLCGVASRSRIHAAQRLNYRLGFRVRKLITPIGSFSVRIHNLRYFVPRVFICKRARRLAPQVLETLSRLLAAGNEHGVAGSGHDAAAIAAAPLPATRYPLSAATAAAAATATAPLFATRYSLPATTAASAASLIKLLWTLDLSDDLLADLTARLVPILEDWRNQSLYHEDTSDAKPPQPMNETPPHQPPATTANHTPIPTANHTPVPPANHTPVLAPSSAEATQTSPSAFQPFSPSALSPALSHAPVSYAVY